MWSSWHCFRASRNYREVSSFVLSWVRGIQYLLRYLVDPKGEPVFPSSLERSKLEGVLGDLKILSIKCVFGTVDKGDSLPHI